VKFKVYYIYKTAAYLLTYLLTYILTYLFVVPEKRSGRYWKVWCFEYVVFVVLM